MNFNNDEDLISTYKLYPSNYAESAMALSNKLIIEGTKNTPWVMYVGNLGILEIKGNSSPESSIDFYTKILQQLDTLSANVIPTFQFNVALIYFNTSSAKCLFDIFRKLTLLKISSTNVIVN